MKKTFTFFLIFFLLQNISISQWVSQNSGTTQNLNSLFIYDQNTGWVCGYSGIILKTTNGGTNWFQQSLGLSSTLNSIFFVNNTLGWAVGYNGAIIKTTNGGTNWIGQNSITTMSIESVYFINSTTGWITGTDSAKIYNTTNGGLNWSLQFKRPNNAYYNYLFYIQFVDNNIGKAVGDVILTTINGGNNWNNSGNPAGPSTIYYIYFIDQITGWLASNLGIMKTTNNGISWLFQYQSTTLNKCIRFLNNNIGYFCGTGGIFKSTNSGNNWVKQSSISLTQLFFANENIGWAIGDNGQILKTTNGGGVFVKNISSEIPEKYMLYQNYPNPFNPSTNIKFEIKDSRLTILKIYDIQGREIETLVNERLFPGSYSVEWNALQYSSGVYFYKITSGDFVEIKKMTLIK